MFFWLSGAGTETLEQCPNWEQRKYVAFGATVLVPCAFAFIACAYALSTLTGNGWVIFSVAGVWAFIILTIDRALLASYRPFLSIFKKFGQFMLRFVVAGLMGLTIAHPLVLLLFQDTVRGVIEAARTEEVVEKRVYYEGLEAEALVKVRGQEAEIAKQRERWNETFSAKFLVQEKKDGVDVPLSGLTEEQQTALKGTIAEATALYRTRIEAVDVEVAKLNPVYTKVQAEMATWQEAFENEVNGQRSGIVGLGPRARSIRDDQLAWRRTEAVRLGQQLKHLTEEKSKLLSSVSDAESGAIATFEKQLEIEAAKGEEDSKRLAELRRKVDADQADQFVGQQNALRETIKQQIDGMLVELDRMQGQLASLGGEKTKGLASIENEPRKDILTQTLALHSLFQRGESGGEFAFLTYWILTLLFMLVDTIPLMVKFFCKAGPYDKLLDQDEVRFDADHKAFLRSHLRYMNQLGEGDLVSVTRNKVLENSLVDGVEHSRAAQAFLDSLIELERSFAEKMQQEEEAMPTAGAEKREMLEAMKKRFYADMHQRMELFFRGEKPA